MSPFYRRLPNVPGLGVEATADKVGLTVVGITAAGIAAHAIASVVRKSVQGVHAHPEVSAEKEENHSATKEEQQ
jgi:hydrogenase small subunit